MSEEVRVVIVDDYANRVLVSQEQQNAIDVLTTGIQGAIGTQIITSTGVPSGSIGRIGDFYLNSTLSHLYGPKTSSGWGATYIALAADALLDDILDVTLSATADQNVLMYETQTSLWKNQKIRHKHLQTSPSAEWNISHGLKTQPAAVSVFDTSNTEVFGDIDHVSITNMVIRFSASFAGTAYLT